MNIHEIGNVDNLVHNLSKDNNKIIGFGCFSYGINEYWATVISMIQLLLQYDKRLDIALEDIYPKTKNINDIINRKSQFVIGGDYYYNSQYPLESYASPEYDSIEFLNFIQYLLHLNNSGANINIFGVGPLFHQTIITNLAQAKVQEMNKDSLLPPEFIYKYYPSMYNDNSSIAKYVINNSHNFRNKDVFMANMVKYIYEKRKSPILFLGHVQYVQKLKLDTYKSFGYLMNKKYGNKYAAIGTASALGKIKFTGEYNPGPDFFKKPLQLDYVDMGSLQRYVQNNYNFQDYVILKIKSEMGYSYYISDGIKYKNSKNANYSRIDYIDYIIYFKKVTPTHNIVL